MRRRLGFLAILAVLATLGTLIFTSVVTASGEEGRDRDEFEIRLTGETEVPGPGDPDGKGQAAIDLDRARSRVCFRLGWQHITAPFAAHIHVAPPGEPGPVVVTLFAAAAPLPDTLSGVRGCASNVDAGLIKAIIDRPRQYYVNVHTNDFPGGAIRGQLP